MTVVNIRPESEPVPAAVEAEQSLLGALMMFDGAGPEVVDVVTADDFYSPTHRSIAKAIFSLLEKGQSPNQRLVESELQRLGEQLPEKALLKVLFDRAGTKSAARGMAQLIAERATQRRLIDVSTRIQRMAYAGSDSEQALLEVAESELFNVRRSRDSELHSVGDGIQDWLRDLELRAQRGGKPEVSTGFYELDQMTGGLHPSRLTILAARTSMGKTSLAGALALQVASNDLPVLFVSAEMAYEELLTRFMAQEGKLVGSDLTRGHVTSKDWERISKAAESLQDRPIEVLHSSGPTLLEIRSNARRVMAKHGKLSLIVVDYLQFLVSKDVKENRQVEIATFTRGLKALANDLKVPVVALSQLNRNLEMRAEKRPTLSDLRESGAIENDADVVILIYRDEYYNQESKDAGVAELVVAKNRHGPTGTVKVAANMASGRWLDMEKGENF